MNNFMEDYIKYMIERYAENYVAEKFKWLIYTQLGFFIISIFSLVLKIWEFPYAMKIGITSSIISIIILIIYRILVKIMADKIKEFMRNLMR